MGVTPKTSGIPGGMDAGQLCRPVVVGTTDGPYFVNPSETSTEVPDLNVEMKNDEHKEAEENISYVQGIEGAGASTEAVDRRIETPAPTNPSTSHKVDANVTRQKTSKKRNNMKLIKKVNIWRMHCQGLMHYMVKVSSIG